MAEGILCPISFLEKKRERKREIFHCINNKIAERDFVIL